LLTVSASCDAEHHVGVLARASRAAVRVPRTDATGMADAMIEAGNSNGLFHRPRPPTPCHLAGARARACPLPPAPPGVPRRTGAGGTPLASPGGRWQAAGRPGSAGQEGLLVTGSGPPRTARGRMAGCGRQGRSV